MNIIPKDWLPDCRMDSVKVHWTAGGHKASPTDLRAYHLLVEGDGKYIKGTPSIALNSGSLKTGYAAHTLNANTNAIGLSMCGMAGAIERPFNPGRAPLTRIQFERAAQAAAELCAAYSIPVTRRTVLFHAEVQATLGIAQRGKWDVIVLPFDTSIRGAHAVGDYFRKLVSRALHKGLGGGADLSGLTPSPDDEPIPEGAQGRVTAATLNFRRGPGTKHTATGSLPAGTIVTINEVVGEWLNVTTPAGHTGFVSRQYVAVFDGPPAEEPSKPDPIRDKIAKVRALLDEIEDDLAL